MWVGDLLRWLSLSILDHYHHYEFRLCHSYPNPQHPAGPWMRYAPSTAKRHRWTRRRTIRTPRSAGMRQAATAGSTATTTPCSRGARTTPSASCPVRATRRLRPLGPCAGLHVDAVGAAAAPRGVGRGERVGRRQRAARPPGRRRHTAREQLPHRLRVVLPVSRPDVYLCRRQVLQRVPLRYGVEGRRGRPQRAHV